MAKRRSPLPRTHHVPTLSPAYRREEHREWPHVVKFSGGRSSAFMLLALLKSCVLKPSRGDVILFNNTSAEHPATYRFAAICKRIAEDRYNIPCFWVEFQTFEDARRGRWRRLSSYRLVQPYRFRETHALGYRYRGEVFEELLSWKQQLPTRFARLCTQHLKLAPTAAFLQDWFGRKEDTPRLGHWYGVSQIDESQYRDRSAIARQHLNQPPARAPQIFERFTRARLLTIRNRHLNGKIHDGIATLLGENAIQFVSLVGLRADEPRRVARIEARNDLTVDLDDHNRLADGEYVYAPLADTGIDKEEVLSFWRQQRFDLGLPPAENRSNCVYCFMKGERLLSQLATGERRVNGKHLTPDQIAWWVDIEARYARVRQASRNAAEMTRFGFFGANADLTYKQIEQAARAGAIVGEDREALPCDCTD